MSLLVGLNFREQLDSRVATELDEMIGALQSGFVNRAQGQDMALLLGLQSPELLDPVVRDELDQVMAAIQTAFNSQTHNIIRSVRRGTITLALGSDTGTYSWIDPVDVNNTVVNKLGQSTTTGASVNDRDNGWMRVELTNKTTVTAYRGQLNDSGGTVAFEVIEYQPGVLKSVVQRGVIDLNAVASNTATIAVVNSDRSSLANLGIVSVNASGSGDTASNVRLGFTTSGGNVLSSVITASRQDATGRVLVGYEVREFY